MIDPIENLKSNRYKKCGNARPNYDQDGHYDEVICKLMPSLCGDDDCPMDGVDK